MRLLHTSTLKLHEFYGDATPDYAILSHTWGEAEVTLQDLEKTESKSRGGYMKIRSCCELAASEGWKYVWIDTCCIDKTSSAELSEAINSMYRWYQDAEVCYAYLVDVSYASQLVLEGRVQRSRWFTRGWTLQELLAPNTVVFYDQDWKAIGTKWSLKTQISQATGISYADMVNPKSASVAAKMSWAAKRKTTRLEDTAYCLLGIFDLTMPLLYGEGRNAYMRLQNEIVQARDDDESIFAWRDASLTQSGILAQSPTAFAESGDIVSVVNPDRLTRPPRVTKRMLIINAVSPGRGALQAAPVGSMASLITLNCARRGSPNNPIGIEVVEGPLRYYVRSRPNELLVGSSLRSTKKPDCPGLYNGNLEIWLDYMHPRMPSRKSHSFLIESSLLNHGFRLSDTFMVQSELVLHDDVEGWQITLQEGQSIAALMFTNGSGDYFTVILIVDENIPSIDVIIPKGKESSTLGSIVKPYQDPHYQHEPGADWFLESLQGKYQILVTLKKRIINGQKLNVVGIGILDNQFT